MIDSTRKRLLLPTWREYYVAPLSTRRARATFWPSAVLRAAPRDALARAAATAICHGTRDRAYIGGAESMHKALSAGHRNRPMHARPPRPGKPRIALAPRFSGREPQARDRRSIYVHLPLRMPYRCWRPPLFLSRRWGRATPPRPGRRCSN
jgi:hypothetical protein